MIRDWLPRALRAPLWGDRARWGLVPNVDDPCWRSWQGTYVEFYEANQRTGVGTRINDAGYAVMRDIDLAGRRVLEVGPGDIRHARFWRGRPGEMLLADVQGDMLRKGEARMAEAGVRARTVLLQRGAPLPLEAASVDVIVSFYSLEHLYPLEPYLEDWHRVLRPGGCVVGAIPTEGGLAWGLGRYLTSRRWFKRHTDIDPDKIICWEHPSFADEVLAALDRRFERRLVRFWPLPWLRTTDVNLIIRFVYGRRESG